MTREEIQSEKIDTQKELLSFEERHGRPVSFCCRILYLKPKIV